ncbi:MAG TPA: TIM-barrel domain-containing protein [Acetobacteraceae bacterium]|nr:TIM-barrel domain-containing protein [Acetobacteraceae bacterium]
MAERLDQEIALSVGTASVRVSTVGSAMVRVAIGDRGDAAPSSYLPERPSGHSADEAQLTADAADGTLTFRSADGRALLRFAIDSAAMQDDLGLRFEVVGEQHFYGLGEGGQQFDRLGIARRFWNFQANRGQGADIAIPLLVSQAGYALFFDNSAAAHLETADVYDGTWLEYKTAAAPLDFYVIGGRDLRAVFAGIADLLGHATMPLRWALGYMQSSRHFNSPDEVQALGRTFRDKGIPCDVLIFLSTYGDAKGMNRGVGFLEFEPDLFANAGAILDEFHRSHFRVLSHEYPVLHPQSPAFGEAAAEKYLLDYGYPDIAPQQGVVNYKAGQRCLDFSRPEVRRWWWQQHAALVAHGIDGWWLDGGEGPPAATSMHAGLGTVLHNRFDLFRQQAFFEGEQADRQWCRPFLLCRSGGPGMQRFGAMPWSGDINATFESMETQIRTGLNLAMSGVPHWGTDTGGFYTVAPDDGELFVRWLQFSAFCSIFRAHGHVWRRHLPWSHGPDKEAICRRYIELRYRLMPYTYTLAWQAHRNGLPTMRPLVLNYPDDPRVWDLGTQFLWGDDLLVAPVTRAGATHWPVYLPQGTWHDYWTHETYHGPGGITVATPLDTLPLFVRDGAIIPLGPVMQYDGEKALTEITLLIYPAGESAFTLYEDDGSTQRYRGGAYAQTEIKCVADAAGLTCCIAAATGDATVIPPGRSYVLRIRTDRTPRSVMLDDGRTLLPGTAHDRRGWWRDDRFLVILAGAASASVRIDWQ